MRRAVMVAMSIALLLGVSPVATSARHAPPAESRSYVVVFHDAIAHPGALARSHARLFDAHLGFVFRHALRGYSARMTSASARAIAQLPHVSLVTADRIFRAQGQLLPTGVDRVNADRSPTADIDGDGVRVDADIAVLDTGVDLNHPDLRVVRRRAKACVGTRASDPSGHGTLVSGIAAALDNGRGVVGVAPGARIWPVRVLDARGRGTTARILCGIDYVTRHSDRIEVANLSLASRGRDDGQCGLQNDDIVHRAVCRAVYAGVTFVAAAGNKSIDVRRRVPAAYGEVIAVSALADYDGRAGGRSGPTCGRDRDDTFANFSNWGRRIDLIAPGTCIVSTRNGDSYGRGTGTSFSTPHVAGAAALYMSNRPGVGPARVRRELRERGSFRWWAFDDPDFVKEPLVSAASL